MKLEGKTALVTGAAARGMAQISVGRAGETA
jgi:hypothetical protein